MLVIPVTLFLAMVNAATVTVPVAPATPEVNAKAAHAVRTAFASAETLRHATIAAEGLSIGPRLWAASVGPRKMFKKETKDTYAIVSSPQIAARWKLPALDLAAVPAELRPILTEAAKVGTPVLAGAVLRRVNEILPALVLAQVTESDFPFSVRNPTDAELQYYYSLIPYPLSAPILVVEGGTHAFLCDFDDAGKLFYFEML